MPESHIQEAKPHVGQLPLSMLSNKTFILLLQPRTAHRPQPCNFTEREDPPGHPTPWARPGLSLPLRGLMVALSKGRLLSPQPQPPQWGHGQQPYLSQVWL